MAAARMVWHDWFVEALAGWLDDIHVLCLGAATRALQQLVTESQILCGKTVPQCEREGLGARVVTSVVSGSC